MSENPEPNAEAASPAHLTDEVQVHLNGVEVTNGATLPKRPAASASKAAWIDYAVALGADRAHITDGGSYIDSETEEVTEQGGLTKDAIVALADRLGG